MTQTRRVSTFCLKGHTWKMRFAKRMCTQEQNQQRGKTRIYSGECCERGQSTSIVKWHGGMTGRGRSRLGGGTGLGWASGPHGDCLGGFLSRGPLLAVVGIAWMQGEGGGQTRMTQIRSDKNRVGKFCKNRSKSGNNFEDSFEYFPLILARSGKKMLKSLSRYKIIS